MGVTAEDIERERDRLPRGWASQAACSSGAPRQHYELSWDGLRVAERKKQEFAVEEMAG